HGDCPVSWEREAPSRLEPGSPASQWAAWAAREPLMRIQRYAAAILVCLLASAAAASRVPRLTPSIRIAPLPPAPTAHEITSDVITDGSTAWMIGPRANTPRWSAVPPLRTVLELLNAYS